MRMRMFRVKLKVTLCFLLLVGECESVWTKNVGVSSFLASAFVFVLYALCSMCTYVRVLCERGTFCAFDAAALTRFLSFSILLVWEFFAHPLTLEKYISYTYKRTFTTTDWCCIYVHAVQYKATEDWVSLLRCWIEKEGLEKNAKRPNGF